MTCDLEIFASVLTDHSTELEEQRKTLNKKQSGAKTIQYYYFSPTLIRLGDACQVKPAGVSQLITFRQSDLISSC